MKKKQKTNLTTKKIAKASLVENSDYFFRDSEMARADMSVEFAELFEQCDITKEKSKINK